MNIGRTVRTLRFLHFVTKTICINDCWSNLSAVTWCERIYQPINPSINRRATNCEFPPITSQQHPVAVRVTSVLQFACHGNPGEYLLHPPSVTYVS